MHLHLAVIVVALLLTVVITVLGLMSMAAGGTTDEQFSTPLMWARVGAQGLTILLLVIAVLTR
jgi:Hypoxia induced protein conserved region